MPAQTATTRKVRCSCGRTFWVVTPQTSKAQCLCGALHDPQFFLESGKGHRTYFSLSVPADMGPEQEPDPPSAPNERAEGSGRDAQPVAIELAAGTSEEQMSFTSKRYGYTFHVPSPGWRRCSYRVERKRGANLAIEHGEFGVLKCVVSKCQLDIEDVFIRLRVACEIEVEDFKLISEVREPVAGHAGARFEYEGAFAGGGGTRYRILRYAFLREGLLYQIVALTSPDSFATLRDETITIVRSFTFDRGHA